MEIVPDEPLHRGGGLNARGVLARVTVHWSEGSLVRKVQNGVFLNIMERDVPVS